MASTRKITSTTRRLQQQVEVINHGKEILHILLNEQAPFPAVTLSNNCILLWFYSIMEMMMTLPIFLVKSEMDRLNSLLYSCYTVLWLCIIEYLHLTVLTLVL